MRLKGYGASYRSRGRALKNPRLYGSLLRDSIVPLNHCVYKTQHFAVPWCADGRVVM